MRPLLQASPVLYGPFWPAAFNIDPISSNLYLVVAYLKVHGIRMLVRNCDWSLRPLRLLD